MAESCAIPVPGHYRILYQDADLVAVHKPSGVHVHPSPLSPREPAMLQAVRDQVGCFVYPAHRLDRPTAGIVLFALSPAIARSLGAIIQGGAMQKTYQAIVRGWFPDQLTMDRPLADEQNGELRDSLTHARCLERFELPMSLGKHATVRLSLVELHPQSGRFHQLRRHLAGAGYPVIYDTGHGDRHHNHFVDREFGLRKLQLFATRLQLPHPVRGQALDIHDPLGSPESDFLEQIKLWSTR